MTHTTVRGLLISMLIGAAMTAGVLVAAPAKSDTTQDYQYYATLNDAGITVHSPQQAKKLAQAICAALEAGNNWRLVITEMMTGADWNLDTASTIFVAATTVYCPQYYPKEATQGALT